MGIRYSGLASAIANGQRVTFDLAIPASWEMSRGFLSK
jgi:hypothetical protein